jgi:hypothetical protein
MGFPPQGVSGAGIRKLSELEIDADKDWNQKRIMNLGAPIDDNDACRRDDVVLEG